MTPDHLCDAALLRRRQRAAALVACIMLAGTTACERPARPVWQDEFEGPAGASFDRTKWVADTGGAGFGNHEAQFYTTRPENVALDGRGHLVITARPEPATTTDQCWYGRCRYTSTRLKTAGRFEQAYGRFEARLRVPRGNGVWPAFWLLGADIGSVGWPRSGEIDVMENRGKEPRLLYGTVHGPGYSGSNGIGGVDTLPAPLADGFHVYAIEWRPTGIRWLVDGRPYHSVAPNDLPPGARWVFDHSFFLLLNFAVAGDWSGPTDAASTFPQQLVVDWVRVYRKP